MDEFVFERLTEKDYDASIRMISEEMIKREPASLLFECNEDDVLKEIKQKHIFCDTGLSVVCKNRETGEIAAVILSNDMNMEDQNPIESYTPGMQDYIKVIGD